MDIRNVNQSLIIICIITGLFIYYRKLDYYSVIPRKSLFAVVLIMIWTYVCFAYSPWFVILGLVILNILDRYHIHLKINKNPQLSHNDIIYLGKTEEF